MEHSDEIFAAASLEKAGGRSDQIVRRTLHHDVLERLRQMIFDGELLAGSKVRENDLCKRFGVSRTPMREALKVLASEGLRTADPESGCGYFRADPAGSGRRLPRHGSTGGIGR